MSQPLYNSISDRIRDKIFSGEFHENDKLPSEPVLAEMLGISRATLREALKKLESEGVLFRKHGVGTFVRSSDPQIPLAMEIPRSLTKMLDNLGMIPGTSFMKITHETVYPDDMEKLSLIPGSKVYRIERIRTANGQPVAYTIDVVPNWAMKKYPQWDGAANFSLLEHLVFKCGLKLKESMSTLMPIHSVVSIAEKLDIDSSTHIFFLEGIDFRTDGAPVLFSREYFVPWIFRISVKRNSKYI